MITSLQNPRIKRAVRLRDRRGRQRQGQFVIDGLRELRRALAGGIELEEVFVCEPMCRGPEAQSLADDLSEAGVEQVVVDEAVFEKIAFGDRSEGMLAVAVPPSRRLEELKLSDTALVAILQGVEKPGNVGAVIRSADAAGIEAVVLADGGTDLYNPHVIRASLGTVFTRPCVSADTAEVLDWLRARGLAIFAARVDGSITYTQADFTGPCALVCGSESEGLPAAWQGTDMTAVRLPMQGEVDSLNVSAAAAVLFFEARRQREAKSGSADG